MKDVLVCYICILLFPDTFSDTEKPFWWKQQYVLFLLSRFERVNLVWIRTWCRKVKIIFSIDHFNAFARIILLVIVFSQRTHEKIIITSLLRQNDVATSF